VPCFIDFIWFWWPGGKDFMAKWRSRWSFVFASAVLGWSFAAGTAHVYHLSELQFLSKHTLLCDSTRNWFFCFLTGTSSAIGRLSHTLKLTLMTFRKPSRYTLHLFRWVLGLEVGIQALGSAGRSQSHLSAAPGFILLTSDLRNVMCAPRCCWTAGSWGRVAPLGKHLAELALLCGAHDACSAECRCLLRHSPASSGMSHSRAMVLG